MYESWTPAEKRALNNDQESLFWTGNVIQTAGLQQHSDPTCPTTLVDDRGREIDGDNNAIKRHEGTGR